MKHSHVLHKSYWHSKEWWIPASITSSLVSWECDLTWQLDFLQSHLIEIDTNSYFPKITSFLFTLPPLLANIVTSRDQGHYHQLLIFATIYHHIVVAYCSCRYSLTIATMDHWVAIATMDHWVAIATIGKFCWPTQTVIIANVTPSIVRISKYRHLWLSLSQQMIITSSDLINVANHSW